MTKSRSRYRSRWWLSAVAFLVLLAGRPANAMGDNDAIGFSPNHIFDGAVQGENIDVLNGNVNLRIPLGPRYTLSDRFSYQVELYYNSKVWYNKCESGECPGQITAPDQYGLGFNIHFGRIYHHPEDEPGVYRFQSPDGGERFVCLPLTDPTADCGPVYTSTSLGERTYDASKLQVSGTGPFWIDFPDTGTTITFGHDAGNYDPENMQPWGGWYATRVTGPNGQYFDIEYVDEISQGIVQDRARLKTITDSAQRTITFEYPSAAAIDIRFPALGGTEAVYALELSQDSVDDPEQVRDGLPGFNPPSYLRWRLDKLILPDAIGEYTFDYGTGAIDFGYLRQWILPTGVAVDYYYGHYPTGSYRPWHSELNVKEITLEPGATPYRWTYTRVGDDVIREPGDVPEPCVPGQAQGCASQFYSSNPHKVRVLDPFDNLTIYWFWAVTLEDCTESDGCAMYWYAGTLNSVEQFAGPEQDYNRMVHRVAYEYMYDGDYAHFGPGSATKNRIGLNVRLKETETTTPAGPSYVGGVLRQRFSDWQHVDPSTGSPDYGKVPRARKVETLDGYSLYRSFEKNYDAYSDASTHTYRLTRDASGRVIRRTDVQGSDLRIYCSIERHAPWELPEGLEVENCPFGGLQNDPLLSAGDDIKLYS